MSEAKYLTWPLTEVSLNCKDIQGDARDFLDLAGKFDNTAWLLATTPLTVIFRPWDGISADELAQCQNAVIFGPGGELRYEHGSGPAYLRLLEVKPDGARYQARQSSYLLRRDCGSGRILYEEYFQPDCNGFLVYKMGRLCGRAKQ